LNGVGASATNATSLVFDVTVKKDKTVYFMECHKGIITTHLKVIGTCGARDTGTTISFILDPEIWTDDEIHVDKLNERIRQIAYLNPGLTISFTKDKEDTIVYHYPEGLHQYLKDIVDTGTSLIDPIILSSMKDDIGIDIAFTYADNYRQDLYSFVNNVATERAGDHLTGFKFGVNKAISRYIKDNDPKNKKLQHIVQDDTLEGIIAIVAVRVKEPRFEGQGKTAIRMPKLRGIVSDITSDALYEYLSKNPSVAKKLLEKVGGAAHARIAAKQARQAARDQKNTLSSISLPGKLKSCSSRVPEECEIFLVEG
jgi:DNA gyrase subunit B